MPKVGLIFKFQTRGLKTYDQYSMDLRLIPVSFVTRTTHSGAHAKIKNKEELPRK